MRALLLGVALVLGMVVFAAPASAQTGGGFRTPFDSTTVQDLFAALQSTKDAIYVDAMLAFKYMVALNLAILALGAFTEGFQPKQLMTFFFWPLIAYALLKNYDTVVTTLVVPPQEAGIAVAKSAFQDAMASLQSFAEFWIRKDSVWDLLTDGAWSVLVTVLVMFSLLFAVFSMWVLYTAQVVTIAVHYVLGPYALLMAASRATVPWAIRWMVSLLAVSFWTLIWGIFLRATVICAAGVPKQEIVLTDFASVANALAGIGIMVCFGFGALGTPLIAHALIGASAGMGMVGVTQAAFQTAGGMASQGANAVKSLATGNPGKAGKQAAGIAGKAAQGAGVYPS